MFAPIAKGFMMLWRRTATTRSAPAARILCRRRQGTGRGTRLNRRRLVFGTLALTTLRTPSGRLTTSRRRPCTSSVPAAAAPTQALPTAREKRRRQTVPAAAASSLRASAVVRAVASTLAAGSVCRTEYHVDLNSQAGSKLGGCCVRCASIPSFLYDCMWQAGVCNLKRRWLFCWGGRKGGWRGAGGKGGAKRVHAGGFKLAARARARAWSCAAACGYTPRGVSVRGTRRQAIMAVVRPRTTHIWPKHIGRKRCSEKEPPRIELGTCRSAGGRSNH